MRIEPDRESLSEILDRVRLRVPIGEVNDEVPALGARLVGRGIGRVRISEQDAIALAIMQLVAFIDRMPRFVPKYSPRFGLTRSLHLQHLAALQPHQTRVCQIKWDREPKHAVRIEELLGQPDMGQRNDAVRLQFTMQTLDPARHQGAVQLQRQVAQAGRQQGLVAGIREHERRSRAWPTRARWTGRHDAVRCLMRDSAAARMAASDIKDLAIDGWSRQGTLC